MRSIADLDDTALQQSLAHLQGTEFLYELRLFPEHVYTFKHALTHEVAYSSLLQERRRVVHARIVDSIERLFPERLTEHSEWLAHHALRGELWDRVVRYAWQAGRRAVDRSAVLLAATYFDQALTALTHLPENRETLIQNIELRLDRALPHFMLGEFEHVLACNQEALRLADILGELFWLTRATFSVANGLWSMGENHRALTFAQRAVAMAERLGEVSLQVVANLDLGIICNTVGDYRHGAAALEKSVTFLQGDLAHERFGRAVYPAVTTRTTLVTSLAELGEFGRAMAIAEEALQIADTFQQPASLVLAQRAVCTTLLRQGAFQAAIPRLERALALCRAAGLHAWYASTAGMLGYAYTMVQRAPEALPLLDDAAQRTARSYFRATSARTLPHCLDDAAQRTARSYVPAEAFVQAYLGEAYLYAGRPDRAQEVVERTLPQCQERGARGTETWLLAILGAIYAHGDPPASEAAEAAYRQALALAEALGMRPRQAHCHRGLGTLYARTGQWAQAQAELSRAIAMYRTLDMTFWPPRAEAVLAQVRACDNTQAE